MLILKSQLLSLYFLKTADIIKKKIKDYFYYFMLIYTWTYTYLYCDVRYCIAYMLLLGDIVNIPWIIINILFLRHGFLCRYLCLSETLRSYRTKKLQNHSNKYIERLNIINYRVPLFTCITLPIYSVCSYVVFDPFFLHLH